MVLVPWNMPQSINTALELERTSKQAPVTVPQAP
jgi:hypothetical protein